MGEVRTESLETAGDGGRRDEAGPSVQGSCSSEVPIQSLLVQDESGGGLVADGNGATVPGVAQVEEVRMGQAAPVVEEEGSNGENEEVRVNRKGDKRDHAKEVGGIDLEGRTSVQAMQIVHDLD
jgi:hypothetical protein